MLRFLQEKNQYFLFIFIIIVYWQSIYQCIHYSTLYVCIFAKKVILRIKGNMYCFTHACMMHACTVCLCTDSMRVLLRRPANPRMRTSYKNNEGRKEAAKEEEEANSQRSRWNAIGRRTSRHKDNRASTVQMQHLSRQN